jgi:hypothetical protein
MWHGMVVWMRQGVTSSSALGHPENRIFLGNSKILAVIIFSARSQKWR